MALTVKEACTKVANVQRDICEIATCMTNIGAALKIIDEFGITAQSIRTLNTDGGFKELCASIKKPTTAKVCNALETQRIVLWDKYVNKLAEARDLCAEYGISGAINAVPSEEGWWRRLTYIFTTDFKCAAKIDDLVKTVAALKGDEEQKFLDTKIDYPMQDKKNVYNIMKFADVTMMWAKANMPEIEKLLKGFFVSQEKRDSARIALVAMSQNLAKKLPFPYATFKNLTNGCTANGTKLPKGKTLKELGYTKADILAIAKDFKKECSGSLVTLKNLNSMANDLYIEAGYNVTTYYTFMQPVIAFIEGAITCYKYVDYFLYYLSKEV